LQDVLIANDPDGLVVDFYRVDYRADAALASIGLAVVARLAASICFRSALRKECYASKYLPILHATQNDGHSILLS
jgi:hypothetical protein